jgi:hypothetical protein
LDQRKQVELHWLQDPSELMGIIWTIWDVKPAGISGIKRGNIWKKLWYCNED